MAKRALVYRKGTAGLVCAAVEVLIQSGTEGRQGSITPLRECTELATVTVDDTRFCAACGQQIARSRQSTVRVQRPRNN